MFTTPAPTDSPSAPVEDVVEAARRNDPDDWTSIDTGSAPLVQSVLRQYRLSDTDSSDVAQSMWSYEYYATHDYDDN